MAACRFYEVRENPLTTLDMLTEIFRDVFDSMSLEISTDTGIDDIEDWDSVAQVNLVLSIESAFGVRFSLDQATGTNSVGGFIAAIEELT